MRYLLLTRGMPLCGKTTWIQEYNLQNYTLSQDIFRNLTQSPMFDDNGNIVINNKNDKIAHQMLFIALETRMLRGDFVIIEDNHISKSYFSNYKEMAKIYAYKIIIVDFSLVPFDVIVDRNKQKLNNNIYYSVDELQNMYKELQNSTIPIKCDIISPDEITKLLDITPFNLNGYKVIHHIGDIQGSYSVLTKYLGKIRDDEFYIFLGDYIDRGFQNYEVLKFLLTIMDKKNVCLIEGNHEKRLWEWANNRSIDSKEFRLNTQIELEQKGFSKNDAKRFYNKLIPYFFYKFHDKMVICTHGGLSNMPTYPILLSASQSIHGVGSYVNVDTIAKAFAKNTPNNFYQFFGHRNKAELPICLFEKNFIMESKVEFGGYLRAVQLNQHGFIDKSIKNTLFVSKQEKDAKKELQKFIDFIEKNKKANVITKDNLLFVNIKTYSNDIIESNYSFYPLIVDIKKWQIEARGYHLNSNKTKSYKDNKNVFINSLKFPLYVVRKHIGKNIIISYRNSKFFAFNTESRDNLPYYIDNKDKQEKISTILKNHSYSIVISQLTNNKHILLDVFSNDLLAQTLSHSDKKQIANIMGLEIQGIYCNIGNIQSLNKFIIELDRYNLKVAQDINSSTILYTLKYNETLQKQETIELSSLLNKDKNLDSVDCYNFLNSFFVFDKFGNFFELPSFYNNELQAINHFIKIWNVQENVSKLQWINNPFREAFYYWFEEYIKTNKWRDIPIEWIQNKFLHFLYTS